MKLKEKIEFLEQNGIVQAKEIISVACELNVKRLFVLSSDTDFKIYNCNDWELETQEKYFEFRKKCFDKGYRKEIMFSKKNIKSIVQY